jgi:hypothetical protein
MPLDTEYISEWHTFLVLAWANLHVTVDVIFDIESLPHHSGIQPSLKVSKISVSLDTISNDDFFHSLRDILVHRSATPTFGLLELLYSGSLLSLGLRRIHSCLWMCC